MFSRRFSLAAKNSAPQLHGHSSYAPNFSWRMSQPEMSIRALLDGCFDYFLSYIGRGHPL
jgi:hypothetical protein